MSKSVLTTPIYPRQNPAAEIIACSKKKMRQEQAIDRLIPGKEIISSAGK